MTVQKEDSNLLRLGLAQIAPVWLDRARTLLKVETYVEQAAGQGCQLVVFGEALVPGNPFWPELTDGARFNSARRKFIFSEYAAQADGGSCVAGPDGEWIIPPAPSLETLLVATIDHKRVGEECQNFDPSGHCARADVTRLLVNRKRQRILALTE